MQTLEGVNGDLSNNQKAFREYMAKLELKAPAGLIKLDQNRQAIADIFLTEVVLSKDGKLYNKVVKVTPMVDQTMGWDRKKFLGLGPVSRENPPCK